MYLLTYYLQYWGYKTRTGRITDEAQGEADRHEQEHEQEQDKHEPQVKTIGPTSRTADAVPAYHAHVFER